jgi:carbonic anhydrase
VGVDDPDAPEKAMRAHVGRTVRRLNAVDVVADAVTSGRVAMVGAVYDLDTGLVELLP